MNTIIRLTLLEMSKKKVLYITLVLTVGFLVLYGTMLHYGYKSLCETENLIRVTLSAQLLSFGVYIMGFIIAFLSIFSSVSSISNEIEKGTIDTILSKPIHRYEIILGRLFGVLLVIIVYTSILYLGVIGLNMFFGKGLIAKLEFKVLIKALGILYLLPTFLCSLGILLGIRMSTMAGGITLFILYFCAMLGGFLENISNFIDAANAKAIVSNIGIIISLIIPSDIIYKKVTSTLLTTSSGISFNITDVMSASTQPSIIMMIYICVYILFIIYLTIKKFGKMDF